MSNKLLITGAYGMVGRALVSEAFRRCLNEHQILRPTHSELDLTDRERVHEYILAQRPTHVIHAAARVGGIIANSTSPVPFFVDNMRMEMNVLEACHDFGVGQVLFLGSACAYPKRAATPIMESSLLTGPLEKSNEMYALAKICGMKLCDAYRAQYGCRFISAMPTNLYGRGDHYDLQNSHVIPGMIRRIHEAKVKKEPVVKLWGTGKPKREFLFADDLARACFVLLSSYDKEGPVNIGSGVPVTLSSLAWLIAEVVGYEGVIFFDDTKPDGTPDRTMNSDQMFSMGWAPITPLPEGLKVAYEDFLTQV